MKLKLINPFITIYLLLVNAALFLMVAFPPPGELAYLSVYGLGAVWILTLPWSMLMIIFAWALIHDTQKSDLPATLRRVRALERIHRSTRYKCHRA